MQEEAYSNIVREAQEIVELGLKAMLREIGVEPPKFHDVGGFLLDHHEKFPVRVRKSLQRLADISARLRKERELSFYGDVDFIPTERYSKEDALRAQADAKFVLEIAEKSIGGLARKEKNAKNKKK